MYPSRKNIAIIRRNGLGDLLCAFPLVRYFQTHEPDARITLFVDQRNAPLVPYLPKVDEVVVFPAKGNKYINIWRTARRYKRKFDLAVCAKTSPMKLMNVFLGCLQSKKSVAYVDSSFDRRFVSRPTLYDPIAAKEMHQALKGLKLVAPELEEVPEALYPSLHVPKKEKLFDLPSTIFLVSATTTRPASRLNAKRYAAILNRLHKKESLSVVVIGQQEDATRAHEIAAHLNAPNMVYFPRNFEEFMVCLDAAELYFVGDGGIGHIGAALGKRGVVLYGETNPIQWSPLSKKMETLYHPSHVDQLNDDAIFEALKRVRKSG